MINNSNLIVNKKDVIFRLLVVIGLFAIWMIYRFIFLYDNVQPWNFKYCIDDKILTYLLEDLTKYLSQNLTLRNMILISGMTVLDIFFVCFIVVFVIMGNSWKPIIHLALFYGIRGVFLQSVFLFEFYDTYLFDYPDFPSLVVPYFRAPDFFYSGHAGGALVLSLHFRDFGFTELFYFGISLSFYEGFVMTVTRAHYSVDIIFGMMMAHYLYFMSFKIGNYLDNNFPVCFENKKITYSDKTVEIGVKEGNNSREENDKEYNNVYKITEGVN